MEDLLYGGVFEFGMPLRHLTTQYNSKKILRYSVLLFFRVRDV
jgi:hypothetical protein